MALDIVGGFEGATIAWDSWTVVSGAWQVDGPGRKDANLEGGSFRGRPSGGAGLIKRPLRVAAAERRFGFAYDFGAAAVGYLAWAGGASVDLGNVTINAAGKIEIRIGAAPGTLEETSVGTLPSGLSYIEVRVFISDTSAGAVEVYVNGDHTAAFVSFLGDTQPGSETTINEVRFSGADDLLTFDDYWSSSPTLKYDNVFVGPFSAGDVLTAPSGASATVQSDDTVNSVLLLHSWNGTAFEDNETITGSLSAATADVFAPTVMSEGGLEPGSLYLGPILWIERPVTGDGTRIDMLGSDGDQVNNYQLLDETPDDLGVTHVRGNAVGAKDRYQIAGVTQPNVRAAAVKASAKHIGHPAVLKSRTGIHVEGVDHMGPEISTSTSWDTVVESVFPSRPDTRDQWAPEQLVGTDVCVIEVRGT